MIDPNKLFQLEGGQKRRKLALCFGALERDILGVAEKGAGYNFSACPRSEYIKKLAQIVLADPKLSAGAASVLSRLLAVPTDSFDADVERRVCNCARNALLEILGTFPAEWDLVIAPHHAQAAGAGLSTVSQRSFYEGLFIYAEDIRSPFNLGSIFRTAEALGAEKVFVSPGCTPPDHPRAARSAMGCIETLGWERRSLAELPDGLPVFCLETGGTPLGEFDFPQKGICIIGSEELGASPDALKRASGGRVTIPMKGLKASLNVGVALGILMQKWVEAIIRSQSQAAEKA